MGFFDGLKFWKKKDDFADIKSDPLLNPPMDQGQFGQGFGQEQGGQGFSQQGQFGQGQQLGQGFGQNDFGQQSSQGFGQQSSQGQQFGQGFAQEQPAQYPGPSSFSQFAQSQQPQTVDLSKDRNLEIISLKLDAIKSELDAMSQRLKRLELIAEGETKKQYGW